MGGRDITGSAGETSLWCPQKVRERDLVTLSLAFGVGGGIPREILLLITASA